MRLLVQYRAVRAMPADAHGSNASSNTEKEEMARVMQIASSTPTILTILETAIPEQVSSTMQGS